MSTGTKAMALLTDNVSGLAENVGTVRQDEGSCRIK